MSDMFTFTLYCRFFVFLSGVFFRKASAQGPLAFFCVLVGVVLLAPGLLHRVLVGVLLAPGLLHAKSHSLHGPFCLLAGGEGDLLSTASPPRRSAKDHGFFPIWLGKERKAFKLSS